MLWPLGLVLEFGPARVGTCTMGATEDQSLFEQPRVGVGLMVGVVDALLKEGEQKWKGFESVERADCCGLVFLR